MTAKPSRTALVHLIATVLFVVALVYAIAPSAVLAANSGAIWTTRNDCGAAQQDVNHYQIGEDVYLNGSNFDAGTYSWTITGRPGNASTDPGLVVKAGSVSVDASGSFCFRAYTVADDDGGEYQVKLGTKGDNYRVTPAEPTAEPTAIPTELPPTATPVPTEVVEQPETEPAPAQPTATATSAPTEVVEQPEATSAPATATSVPATSTPPSEVGGVVATRTTVPQQDAPASTPVHEAPAAEKTAPEASSPAAQPETAREERAVAPTAVAETQQAPKAAAPRTAAPVPAMLPETGSAPTQNPLVVVLGVALLGLGLLVRSAGRRTVNA